MPYIYMYFIISIQLMMKWNISLILRKFTPLFVERSWSFLIFFEFCSKLTVFVLIGFYRSWIMIDQKLKKFQKFQTCARIEVNRLIILLPHSQRLCAFDERVGRGDGRRSRRVKLLCIANVSTSPRWTHNWPRSTYL